MPIMKASAEKVVWTCRSPKRIWSAGAGDSAGSASVRAVCASASARDCSTASGMPRPFDRARILVLAAAEREARAARDEERGKHGTNASKLSHRMALPAGGILATAPPIYASDLRSSRCVAR